MPRPSKQATCHAERKHYARGLCYACYRSRVYSATAPLDLGRRATCHPDRAHCSKGLCRDCYTRSNASTLQKQKDGQRLRRYGLSPAAHRAMLAAQGDTCAICKESPVGDALHVDHDHVTNEVRGLLCLKCNVGLGAFRDRPELLTLAVDYLAASTRKAGAA